MGKDVAKELKQLSKVWGSTEAASGVSNIPVDDYVAKLVSIEIGFSKAGNLQAVATFKIYDGKQKGKDVKLFQGLSSEVGISYFKGFCEVIGLEYPDDAADLPDAIDSFMGDFDELVNITVREKDGNTNVRVQGLSEVAAEEDESSEPAEEAEEEESSDVTAEDINKMKRKAVINLIEENGIDVDPDDFEDTDDLKGAVIEELGLLDNKKKNKKKGKK